MPCMATVRLVTNAAEVWRCCSQASRYLTTEQSDALSPEQRCWLSYCTEKRSHQQARHESLQMPARSAKGFSCGPLPDLAGP